MRGWHWIGLAMVFLTAAPLAGCGDDDGDAGGSESDRARGGTLFAHTTRAGTLSSSGGELRLTLTEPAAAVTSFTDRPERRAGRESVTEFVANWDRRFGDDPPNAALVLDQADEDAKTLVLELSDPRREGRAVTYRAKRIEDAGSALAGVATGADESVAERFRSASLFIDSTSAGTLRTQSLQLKVGDAGCCVTLTFDPPAKVVVLDSPGSDPGNETKFVPADYGQAHVKSSSVRIFGGTLVFNVDPGDRPITGTADVMGSGKTILGGANTGDPSAPLRDGRFSIGSRGAVTQ